MWVFLSEASLEEARLAQFVALGYARGSDELIGPDGKHAERESHDEVFLRGRFEAAVARLNPGLPEEARQDALRQLTQSELPALLEENRRIHRLLVEGVDVEYYADDGNLTWKQWAISCRRTASCGCLASAFARGPRIACCVAVAYMPIAGQLSGSGHLLP